MLFIDLSAVAKACILYLGAESYGHPSKDAGVVDPPTNQCNILAVLALV